MATNYVLPIKNLVSVDIDYAPQYLKRDIFNRLCIVGSSANTRGTLQGIYSSMVGVAQHYAADTSEYKMADRVFAQIPRPRSLMIATIDDIVFPVSE